MGHPNQDSVCESSPLRIGVYSFKIGLLSVLGGVGHAGELECFPSCYGQPPPSSRIARVLSGRPEDFPLGAPKLRGIGGERDYPERRCRALLLHDFAVRDDLHGKLFVPLALLLDHGRHDVHTHKAGFHLRLEVLRRHAVHRAGRIGRAVATLEGDAGRTGDADCDGAGVVLLGFLLPRGRLFWLRRGLLLNLFLLWSSWRGSGRSGARILADDGGARAEQDYDSYESSASYESELQPSGLCLLLSLRSCRGGVMPGGGQRYSGSER